MKKHLSEISTDDITKIAQEASLEAREKALNSGSEVISEDDEGNLISETKNEDGSITSTKVEESKDK